MIWTVDASAILSWLNNEPGALRVEEVFASTDPLVIHAVNLLEVQYYLLRRGQTVMQLAMERVNAVGIEVDRSIDDAFLSDAADLKANHAPIALGDVFAVATARRRNATLLTTDRGELEKIAQAGICKIEFVR